MVDDGNIRNGGNFRYVRNDRNVENSGMSGHTSSVIPLQKHKLELIKMMMEIFRNGGTVINVGNVENV